MKVIAINSKMMFKALGTRGDGRVPERVVFFAKAALICWGPTLLFCCVVGAALPLYVLLCSQGLGVLAGVWLYNQRPDGLLSCVPMDYRPDVPDASDARQLGKAA